MTGKHIQGSQGSRTPFIKRLYCDNQGAMLPMIAGSLTMLLGFAGLAVDGARLFYAKDVLQKSLDSAGLAAGHALNQEFLQSDAESFFEANFSAAGTTAKNGSFNMVVSDDNRLITLTATADVETSFMKIFGFDTVSLSASTEITRETRGMELALVMDNTGSMRSGGKITAMKDAAAGLIESVYGDDETNDNLWVSLVPYVASVNIGSQHTSWLSAASQDFLSGPSNDDQDDGFYPTSWKGCVMARTGTGDRTDASPFDAPFEAYFWPDSSDNDWILKKKFAVDETNGAQNNGTGPNLGCGPAITPLIASKTDVLAAIDEMLPWHRGGTTSNLGLVWGWRTLSPNWRGLWGGDSPAILPLDYDTPFMDKVAVVLTDGQNQFFDFEGGGPDGSDFTAYDRRNIFGFTSDNSLLSEINGRFTEVCDAMKAEGIIIYTITFGSTPNTDTQNLYRDCASNSSFYFHAPDNSDLQDAFDTIGRQLSNLRLSR